MNKEIHKRLQWIQLFEKTQDAGLTCRRCGISRPTLRKWLNRYNEFGVDGLIEQSRKPKNSPKKKADDIVVNLIENLRSTRNLGARRIQSELIRLHSIKLSLATIHKVLHSIQAKPLIKPKREKKYKRYNRPIPGDRVQIDVMKIKNGLYQYTAVDDCTRYRVLGLFKRKTAANTLHFLEQVIEEMPFPIQRIQTDRGREFFAYSVQQFMMDYSIKFRPIKPGSPHLNGKVERSQLTDLQEFYSYANLDSHNLSDELAYWQHYYNWERPHGSLNGKSPIDKYFELSNITPYWDDVCDAYDPDKERIKDQNYNLDLQLERLKRSM